MGVETFDMGLGVTDRILDRLRSYVGVETIFGEPVDRDGTTVIPVAKVRTGGGGGGGGGGDDHAGGSGEGGGFGVISRPVGVYVVRDGSVRWEPAIDVGHLVTASAIAISVLSMFSWLKRRRG